jgi:cytoskeleton protein RodZ
MSDQLLLEGVEPPPAVADFAQLRSARGWSVDDVAQQLKISPAKVRAIEKLDFALLPDGPYTRGFIRNYARLLGVDPSPWLNLLENSAAQPVAGQQLVRDDPRRLPAFDDTARGLAPSARYLWWGVAALVVATALFLAWWERARWQGGAQPVLAEATTQTQTQALPAAAQTPAHVTGTSVEPIAVTPPGVAPADSAPVPAATPPATAAAAPNLDTAKAEVPAGHKRVAFSFKSDAWIEVRDKTGKAIVSQLYKAGEQATLTGLPPLRMTVGAAREVALQVDGQEFDMGPHIKTSVARFVVN